MKKRFDWKEFLKALAFLGIPVAFQSLLTTTGSMLDTVMIASMGEKTVGAVGLCAQFSSLMFSCYWGFAGGGMLFMAQYWGAEDEDGMERSFGMMWTFMMSIAVIFCGLAVLAPEFVMKIYTDKPNIQEIGIPYLKIVGFSYPLTVMSMASANMLRSASRVKIPLYASILSVITNIVLNWLLIFGHWGFPKMGVQGAAIATVAAGFVDFVFTYIMARINGFMPLFRIRKHFTWDRAHVKEYVIKCLPIIANELLIGVSNLIIMFILGRQSEEAIAAIAVFSTIEGVFIGFFSGFTNAASVLVGNKVGAGELDTAYERGWRLIYICGAGMLVLSAIFMIIKTPVLSVMGLSGESLSIGKGMVAIFCVVIVIRMCNWLMNDTYRSAGDATTGTVLEIVFMYLMVLPIMAGAAFVLKWPFLVIFASRYIDEPIRVVLMQIHMYSGKWIRPVTEEGLAALPAFREKHHIKVKAKKA